MGIGKKTRNIGEMVAGKAKEIAGKVTGDESMERKGKAEKVKGKVKHAMERGKDTFRH
ncbi:CsbD family protein [Streptomyces sp. NPDC002446]